MSRLRRFGTERFRWDDLLRAPLSGADVYVLYFPSRFDLPVDVSATETLRVFGANTSVRTSVDFWDPTDPNFSEALTLFGLRHPPALVLATGLRERDVGGDGLSDSVYCVAFDGEAVLSDRASMAAAVNIAHEILVRCDRGEIAGYVRGRKVSALLRVIGRGAGVVVDEFLRAGCGRSAAPRRRPRTSPAPSRT